MVELNERDLCLEIHEQLSWDHSVKFIFNEIREELSDWYENNLEDIKDTGEAYDATPEDMDNCKQFLDTVSGSEENWPRELKIKTLKNIMEQWETIINEDSIFDKDVICEGIYQTIEEEFNFDGRMG